MVQSHFWLRLLQARRISNLTTTQRTTNLLGQGFVVAELLEERLMQEVLYVLGVVKGGGGSGPLGDLLLVARFARVDTYTLVNSYLWNT